MARKQWTRDDEIDDIRRSLQQIDRELTRLDNGFAAMEAALDQIEAAARDEVSDD